MIAPFVIKFATDAISLSISSKTALKLDYLILLLIILAISYISSAILGNINGYIGDVLAAKMRFKLSCVYYDHLLILPQSYYDNENTGKIMLVEPFYEGSMIDDIVFALKGKSLIVESIGVPRKVLRDYGTKKEKDILYGLTAQVIYDKLAQFCNA